MGRGRELEIAARNVTNVHGCGMRVTIRTDNQRVTDP